MTEHAKAKILDAILDNHHDIIRRMTDPKYGRSHECGCDPETGYQCEECAVVALCAHLHHVSELRDRENGATNG